MMGWLEDIIESLPGELEELAKLYLPAIKKMGREKALELFDLLRTGGDMYPLLVENMSAAELVADQERSNEILKALNKDNAARVELGWHLFRMIIALGFDKIYD